MQNGLTRSSSVEESANHLGETIVASLAPA